MFALVDYNNLYVSCERVFNPAIDVELQQAVATFAGKYASKLRVKSNQPHHS
jgi:hypothetical protein